MRALQLVRIYELDAFLFQCADEASSLVQESLCTTHTNVRTLSFPRPTIFSVCMYACVQRVYYVVRKYCVLTRTHSHMVMDILAAAQLRVERGAL